MLKLKVVVSASVLFCVLTVLPLNAVRRPDLSSSQNGEVVGVPAELCPTSTATPFFAQLDGTQSPPAGCTPTSDPNKPNPPDPYPNLSVTLSGSGFTVKITPALWGIGLGTTSNAAGKYTVFQVQFSGEAGMTLQSLVIGAKLNAATYVPCVPSEFGSGIPYCVAVDSTLEALGAGQVAIEPTPIDLADNTTTRWDFSQFSSGTLALAVAGYPSEFSKIDKYPNSNTLKAASFVAANFLAVVTDSSNNVLTAGGLTLKKALAATNDLFANAVTIKKVPFKSFLDTSATNPTEQLTGSDAGDEITPQGDPTPKDPAQTSAGTPCIGSWPSGANVFRSVWYEFTPTISENYAVNTAGSRYDTGVYVFTGSPSSPTTVACNDDAPTTGTGVESSYVNFGAVAGTPYYIMVSEVPPPVGFDTATGTIPLAAPLATDATLNFSLTVGSHVIMNPNTVLNFPNPQAVNTTSSPLVITATNTTSTSVTISKVAIYGSGVKAFQETNTCGGSIAGGAHCQISVTFTPLAKGLHIADIQLQFTGSVDPTPLVMTGTGVLP
ncbi:MAG: hypothetical protein WAN60_07785 [Candidatus Sulfotelmatobacter sp.]